MAVDWVPNHCLRNEIEAWGYWNIHKNFQKKLDTILIAFLWYTWKHRNDMVFRNASYNIDEDIVVSACTHAVEWLYPQENDVEIRLTDFAHLCRSQHN